MHRFKKSLQKWLFLLRAFFPSWKFFTDVGVDLGLEVRFGANETSLGTWASAIPKIPRGFNNFLLNPQGNSLHATHNLLNHLVSDLQSIPEEHPEHATHLTTFKLIHRLSLANTEIPIPRSHFYQFRVMAKAFDGKYTRDECILISPVYHRERAHE